jgi:FtsP/CotA-like multicopper oxidase with cupredoxin domain/plastocyanin
VNKPVLDLLPRILGPRLSRRAALGGLGGGITAGMALAAGLNRGSVAVSGPATPNALEPAGEPRLREFVLTASEFDWELMPGATVRAWGYDGRVPGPELRVREGDLVRVTLRNALPVPTTVHWHGVNVPPAMDGPAGLNQAPVAPGESFVYEFVARPAGSRWYHSHADPALQVPLGLYGPLVVEPRLAGRSYDREYTLMLAEWDVELTPDVASGRTQRGEQDRILRGGELGSDLFLINGLMHGAVPPIRLAEGERVLLRLMHAGHLPHPFHTHGHSFKIVATDGNPVPDAAQLVKDTVLIAPGERYDLELVGDNPGVWMVHCHIEHHMANGMMTTLWYDGHQPSGPVGDFVDDGPGSDVAGGHEHRHDDDPAAAGSVPADPSTPTPPAAATAETETRPAIAEGAVEIAMVDDRFAPPDLVVTAGTTVTWVNRGADWHSVAAFDGSFASDQVAPGQTFSHTFTTPGTYKFLCRHHGRQGMVGQIVVTE